MNSIGRTIDQFFLGLSKPALIFLVIFMEFLIALADIKTSFWIPFRSLYVIPIFLATWYSHKAFGISVSLVSAVAGTYDYAQIAPPNSSFWILTYNLFEEGGLFTLIFLFISQLHVQFIKNRGETDELQKMNSLLNATIEATADGILVVDKDGKSIFLYNEQFLKMWRVPESLIRKINETLDDRPLLSYVTTQLKDPVAFFEKVKELYMHPEAESFDTLELADGRIFERYSRAQLLNGKHHGRVWSFRDVTEKKKTEIELLKTMKLESIGLLAGGIAHDFNNILTAILGNISLMRLESNQLESSSRYLDETEKAVIRAQGLANQLLSFAKGGAPRKLLTSLAPLLQDAATFALRGSPIECRFSFPENLWNANIDPGQITQLSHNLVINARQAMGEKGNISISGENAMIGGERAKRLSLTPGFYLVISFKDSGPGIPTDLTGKIFDPFFTTKPTGSGLGLFSAYSIAKNHRGTLTVDSEVGAGSTFCLYLPAVTDQKTQGEENRQPITFGTGRILVMDDDEMIRKMVSPMLQTLGYETELAANGEEAVEKFCLAIKKNLPFHAVILDLTVQGGMGGKQTLQKLLAIDPNVMAIVSSGYSNDPVISKYQEFGFRGSVAKPYRIQDLGKALHDILTRGFSLKDQDHRRD